MSLPLQRGISGEPKILRVSGGTDSTRLGSAAASFVREGAQVTMTAIGAGAVNQMVKAAIIARSMLASSGLDILLRPGFEDVDIGGQMKTSTRMTFVVTT